MSGHRLPWTQLLSDLPQTFTKVALWCVWTRVKFWGSSKKVEHICGSAARGLQKWPFWQLPGDGSCSMNTQNTSLPFSDVFNIFIELRGKAVAVSKSDYTMYSMRSKLSSNLRKFWQWIFCFWRVLFVSFCNSANETARRPSLHHVSSSYAKKRWRS